MFKLKLLQYISKCNHLESRWIFGPSRCILIQIVRFIGIPDEKLFSETVVGCTASYFVKILCCSRWFCPPPLSSFEAVYCFVSSCRRVTIDRYRMICLVPHYKDKLGTVVID